MAKPIITRLAPSPTGHLHLGNAWSFLLCWLAARSLGGKVILRMDDIDPLRSKDEFAAQIREDLLWLGLDWDSECRQSERMANYRAALASLEAKNLTYPCFCTRKELRQLASAPHVEDWGIPYPGTCAGLTKEEIREKMRSGRSGSTRIRCCGEHIEFTDVLLGPLQFAPPAYGNDFALRRSDGVIAYQLATAVDDGGMGVNLVVRGRDLVFSTPRQILLMRKLGLPVPQYAHIPLLLDGGGERLAKRHASLSLVQLRNRGILPSQITGYLAGLANLTDGSPQAPGELLGHFSWERLPGKNSSMAGEIFQDI